MSAAPPVFVLFLLVLSSLLPWPTCASPTLQAENQAPMVKAFSLELEKEQNHYVALVGERIRGYVEVEDPEGDLVSLVMINFTKVGGSFNQSFSLSEGDEPGVFPIDVPTDGWETGRYKMYIVLEDVHGARSIYEVASELWLRIELPAPPGSDVWVYGGLAILSGLIAVLAIAFSRAIGRKHVAEPSSPYPEIF